MGIEVNNKEVSYTDSHEELVNTSIKTNPILNKIHGFPIYSIFKRMRSRESIGDGNPLIYALKRKKGFKINRKEMKNFFKNLDIIVDKILTGKNYDLIIVIPSQHRIGSFLVKRIHRNFKIKNYKDFFQKATIKDVLGVLALNKVHDRDIKEVKRVMSILKKKEASEVFVMKEVKNKIRKYFNPLKLNSIYSGKIKDNQKILIIDDLLSTGATLKNAHDIIKNINSTCEIDGLCLLSEL